jgi:hypothetical protein
MPARTAGARRAATERRVLTRIIAWPFTAREKSRVNHRTE